MFCKINFAYFTEKHLRWSLLLIKLNSLTWNFTRKETLAQVFSCHFFEIFQSTVFYKTPPGQCSCCSMVFSEFHNQHIQCTMRAAVNNVSQIAFFWKEQKIKLNNVSQLTNNGSNHQVMFRKCLFLKSTY